MTRAVDVLRQVAPKAKADYLAAFDNGDALLQQHGITTPDRLAHFLAQVLHESGGLTLEHESMKYSADRLVEIFGPERHSAAISSVEAQSLARNERAIAERVYGQGNPPKARELGNIKAGDAFRYRGCGLMQTTGRANFRRIGRICGVDFEQDPSLICSPEHALKPALAEWSEAGLNRYADNNDILGISRAINCGSPRSKRIPNGLQDRATWFAKVRARIDRIEFRVVPVLPRRADQSAMIAQEPRSGSSPVMSVAEIVGDGVFRLGDEGHRVRAIQVALAQLGYPLRGTGTFGTTTLSATKDFQQTHGLDVDGEIGSSTAKAIDAALAQLSSSTSPFSVSITTLVGGRILQAGDVDDAVRGVQLVLSRLGYPLKGTGNFGSVTEQSVRDFQSRQSLEVDGQVGPQTAQAIDRVLSALEGGNRSNPPPPKRDEKLSPVLSSTDQHATQSAADQSLLELLGNSVLGLGDEGAAVKALQLGLAKLGYTLTGTGYFGGATEAAVADFQDRNGLDTDGEVGPVTARAIDQQLLSAHDSKPRKFEQSGAPGSGELRPLWVIEGLKWMNLAECSGSADNPEILKWAEEEGGAIAKHYKHDDIPWCALFANMVLTKVGMKGTETLWALDWSNWGQKLTGPAVGAFAPMKRQGGGHIAIVIGRDKHGNLVCLGGNQDDAVNIKAFPAQRPLSFRWPTGVPLPVNIGISSLPVIASNGRVSTKES